MNRDNVRYAAIALLGAPREHPLAGPQRHAVALALCTEVGICLKEGLDTIAPRDKIEADGVVHGEHVFPIDKTTLQLTYGSGGREKKAVLKIEYEVIATNSARTTYDNTEVMRVRPLGSAGTWWVVSPGQEPPS